MTNVNGHASVRVTCYADTGGPLSITEIDERLNEFGVYEEPDDTRDDEQISNPAGWRFADGTCRYVTKIIDGLCDDGPKAGKSKHMGRHQWACKQAVRLACAWRLGCISESDWRRAQRLLKKRLVELRAATDETVPKYEIPDVFKLGIKRASTKTEDQARRELDDHKHVNGADYADAADGAEAPPKAAELLNVEHLENGFWLARQSLTDIYTAALSRMCSPWAVLAHCAARVLATIPPHVTLPPLVGGPGSLNWFAALVAVSGGGKSAAEDVARELVDQYVLARNLGSGEGVIDAYVRPADKETGEPAGLHESVMFVADEIDQLAALGARSGSTLMSTLRMGFTARTLGFSNRTASSLHLKRHSYRMTLVANVQPARAGALMDDSGGGTPQRFMWFPAKDRRVTASPPMMPAPLALPAFFVWQYPRELKIPAEATALIREENAKDQRGEADFLDGHALFCREKFAYALAALDARDDMTSEDWELSGIAAAVSTHIRGAVIELLARAVDKDAASRGRLAGISHQAAGVSKAQAERERANRIANWIIDRLKAAGRHSMSEGELRRDAESPNRHSIVAVLGALADQGWVKKIDRVKGDRTDRWMLA
jgi:hypothetical protein